MIVVAFFLGMVATWLVPLLLHYLKEWLAWKHYRAEQQLKESERELQGRLSQEAAGYRAGFAKGREK